MRSVIIPLLVLLFSMCGAQTQSTQTEVQTESQCTGATQLDVSAELIRLRDTVEELRTIVVELKVQQAVSQNELQNTKAENEAQDAELSAVKTEMMNLIKANAAQDTELAVLKIKLAASETEVVNLMKETAAQEAELTAVKTRLAASETELENLKMETAAQEAELTEVKTRLAATETDVVNLEKEILPKVAFSAGLTNSGYIEAGNTELNMVFTRIITNVGQAYSNTTGFFTAPVRGVYYFRFTVADTLSSRWMQIILYKNAKMIMRYNEYDSDGAHSYLSGGVALQLEVGDEVNLRIPAGSRLYDDVYQRNVFSGFLLFPL